MLHTCTYLLLALLIKHHTPCQCYSLCTALNMFRLRKTGAGAIRRAWTHALPCQVLPPPCPSSFHLSLRARANTHIHTAYGMLLPINEILSRFRREWKSIPVLIRIAPRPVGESYKAQFPVFLAAPWVGRCHKNTNYKPRSWKVKRYYWAAKRAICRLHLKAQPTASRRADRVPGLSCDIMQSILTATNTTRPLTLSRALRRALIHTRIQRERKH